MIKLLTNLFLHKFEEGIGAICLAIMVTISFLNVITRYCFKFSMAFTEEIVLYLFVWVVMMGTSIAFRDGGNMAVSFFYDKLGCKSKKVLTVGSAVLSLIFFIALTYFGVLEVIDEVQMQAKTEAIELPVWLFTSAMPIASLCIIGRIVTRTKKDIKDLSQSEGSE